MKLVTVDQMRQIEAEADANGILYSEMMERAGTMTARRVQQRLKDLPEARITVLVGKGNNGGDGLVAARYLAEHFDVRCYLLERLPDTFVPFKAAQEANVFMAFAEDDDGRVLRHMVASADLLLDAVFGIGIRLPLAGEAAKLLRRANQAILERRQYVPDTALYTPTQPFIASPQTALQVIAVDCPSGLNCDTGEHDPNTIRADETITYIAPKIGQVTFPGAEFVGQLTVAPLGIPTDLETLKTVTTDFITEQDAQSLLPHRPANSNKGTFGKVMIVAGSTDYRGAPALCAESAYRSGAGLVTIATTPSVAQSIAPSLTESTWVMLQEDHGVIAESSVSILQSRLTGYQSLLIGPGLTHEASVSVFLKSLLQSREDAAALVLDADALNILAEQDDWWQLLPPDTIITPHPGEMARLSQVTVEEVQKNRLQIAQAKAKTWNVVIVLKGAHTIIAATDRPIVVLPFKSDALATAGTGDVLAGLIAGLRAQSISAPEAAILGAFVHGLAGEIAARSVESTRSVIASDVIAAIGSAFARLSAGR